MILLFNAQFTNLNPQTLRHLEGLLFPSLTRIPRTKSLGEIVDVPVSNIRSTRKSARYEVSF